MSVLSTKMTKIVNAKISELMNDGMSDNEIVRALRKHARLTDFPELNHKQIKKMIEAILDADETASDSSDSSEDSEPTFDSDEEDEEWVPPAESDTESETDSCTEDAAATLMELKEEAEEILVARIYFDHKDKDDGLDRILIRPEGDHFAVEVAYNLDDAFADPKCANFFEATEEEVLEYVLSVLRLVAVDDLPFRSTEVSVPFFPTVSYKPKTLTKKYVRDRIAHALRQYMSHFA